MRPKAIASIIVVLFYFYTMIPPAASADEGAQYGIIHASLNNQEKTQIPLNVRIEDGNVYADAVQLGGALGYTVNTDKGTIVFADLDRESNSFGLVVFTPDSMKVIRYVGPYMVDDYEAPFEPRLDDSGAWVPLGYACIMLKSDFFIQDNILHISMPTRNIMDEYALVKQKPESFMFNLLTETAYDGLLEDVMAGAVHNTRVCSEFMDLLFLDGETMTDIIVSASNDAKIETLLDYSLGEELARMICLLSDDELGEAVAGSVNTTKDMLSVIEGSGKLGGEFSGDALSECIKQLQELEKNNTGLAAANSVKENIFFLEKVNDEFAANNELFDKEIADTSSALQVLSNIIAVYNYSSEYSRADQFTLEAMGKLLEDAESSELLSAPTLAAMRNSTTLLDSDIVSYSVSEYILNDGANLILEAIQMGNKFSTQYQALQLGWNLGKKYIPGLSTGLEAADEFELSLLASILQVEAYRQYSKNENNLLEFSADSESLYELIKPFYIYVKAGEAARKAALAYAEHTLGESHEDVIYLKEEFSRREELTTQVLCQIRKAQPDNANGAFGFLPEDNQEYLNNYSDEPLIQITLFGEEAIESAPADIDYSVYIPAIQKAINGQMYDGVHYGIMNDYNGDGIEELILLNEYEQNGLPTVGLSVYSIDQGALTAIAENQSIFTMAGGGTFFAGITEYKGEKYLYSFSMQMGDMYADSNITVFNHDMSVMTSFKADINFKDLYLPDEYTAVYRIDSTDCEEEEYSSQLEAIFSFDVSCFKPENAVMQTKTGMFFDGGWYGDTFEDLIKKLEGGYSYENIALPEASVLAAYKPVLDEYYRALCNGFSLQEAHNAGLCHLIGYGSLSDIGYTFSDIDGKGTPELIIGELNSTGDYVGMFFDLFTIEDNVAKRVVSSTERSRFYLCENGILANEGSGGAFLTQWGYYYFDGDTNLTHIESIVYDADFSPESPWFMCRNENDDGTLFFFTEESYIPTTEAEAKTQIGSYHYREIEYIPFTEYPEYIANYDGETQKENGSEYSPEKEENKIVGQISESEAKEIASLYWADLLGESDDTWSDFAIRSDGTMEYQGKLYYNYTLTGFVENHRTAVDYLYIDSENGDCYYGLGHPEELKRHGAEMRGQISNNSDNKELLGLSS